MMKAVSILFVSASILFPLVLVVGCEDRGYPYRKWGVEDSVILDDRLLMVVARSHGRHHRRGANNLLTTDRIECYLIEFPWPLQTDVRNVPRAGQRIDLCDGLQSLHEVRREITRSLPEFHRDERQAGTGLPREVPVEVEQRVAEKTGGDVWASTVVDGEQLFLVRRLSESDVIVKRDGEIVARLPAFGVRTNTVWQPGAHTIVRFHHGNFAAELSGRSLEDYSIVGLDLEVVVYNYESESTEVFEISQHGTAEYLLTLEARGR